MTTSRRTYLYFFAFWVTKFFSRDWNRTSPSPSSFLFAAAAADYPWASSTGDYHNVFGKELQSCSYNGTALTGYTRSGYCVETHDDSGSHHICINLQSNATSSSSSSSSGGTDFCEVTGQSDWCNSDEMPCHENSNDATCHIQNWCVCQWAFASYLQKAGGCGAIQDIDCEATNIEAMRAYQQRTSTKQQTESSYQNAFDCLIERCGLNPKTNFRKAPSVQAWTWFASASLLVALVTTIATLVYRGNSRTTMITSSNIDRNVMVVSQKTAALLNPTEKQQMHAAEAEGMGGAVFA